jgi:hypothetical protein
VYVTFERSGMNYARGKQRIHQEDKMVSTRYCAPEQCLVEFHDKGFLLTGGQGFVNKKFGFG